MSWTPVLLRADLSVLDLISEIFQVEKRPRKQREKLAKKNTKKHSRNFKEYRDLVSQSKCGNLYNMDYCTCLHIVLKCFH